MNAYFGKADVIAKGTNSNISTVEADIVTIPDVGSLSFSQLTMYTDIVLGTHTQFKLRVYCQDEKAGTWYQLIKKNKSTGLVSDDFYLIDSTTPTKLVIDIPISGCFGLKITGQGVGGANATAAVRLLGRSN